MKFGILLWLGWNVRAARSWIPPTQKAARFHQRTFIRTVRCVSNKKELNDPDATSLLEMDVVVYEAAPVDDDTKTPAKQRLGCVQEDGRITPLSAWTLEPAFGDCIEFVVDEHDLFPGLSSDTRIVGVVPSDQLSYGSRQVGGGKGPSNPHGEESEKIYYIEQAVLENVEIVVKPELEILW